MIIGAGFGGTAVARELHRLLRPEERCEITLVDQNNFFLFTPMLTEVASGELDPSDVVEAIRSLVPHCSFEQGRVESIDPAARTVKLVIGEGIRGVQRAERALQADHLVIALGSTTNYHQIPGLEKNALTIKTVEEAEAIRNRALALLERADEEPNPTARRALLTFVVGGGGFSGVETMAALNDFIHETARDFHHVDKVDIRTVLIHGGQRLLPELSEGLARYAQTKLEERGVEVKLGARVKEAGEGYVEVERHTQGQEAVSRELIEAHTLIWTGGVRPNPAVEAAHLELGPHQGIVVDGCCRVPNHPGVWALGDCAEVPKPSGKGTYAPTAQDATREGKRVAQNIVAVQRGRQPRPFTYHPIGELALVGRRSGVASVYGLHFSGALAWLMWRAIYLAKLPRMSHRARVALSWLLDAVFQREIAALPGAKEPGTHPADE